MSNTDNFIDEVTEEVRRERLFTAVKRYGWIGVVAVLAIVGGSAWNEWQKSEREAQAEAFGDQIMAAMAKEEPAARQAALSEIAAEGDKAAMVRLLAAGEALASADGAVQAKALADLAALADDASLSPAWRDLAQLRRLSAPSGVTDPTERAAILAELTIAGRPYRPLALELAALDKVAAGNREAALADFRTIFADQAAPSALRARAGQMIVVLGGKIDETAAN